MAFTAEQAMALSKGKSITEQLNEYLDEIFLHIEKSASASESRSNTSLLLKPWAFPYKDYLFAILRDNGYKVDFHRYISLRDDCNDYFIVSWKECP